jgi:hypothetical protein
VAATCLVGVSYAAEHEGGHGGEEGAEEVQRFLQMDLVTGPIINRNRIRGRLEISIVIEILDQERGADVVRLMPRIHASFVSVAQRYAATLGTLTKPMDLDFLMKGMEAAANRVVPAGSIDVLVQQALYKRDPKMDGRLSGVPRARPCHGANRAPPVLWRETWKYCRDGQGSASGKRL